MVVRVICFNGTTLLAVAERHSNAPDSPENYLASIDTNTGAVAALHQGQDFYSSAAFSVDGKQISWITWMHPQMPWDGTSLWTAELGADGTLHNAAVIAGGVCESIVQPEWSPDGKLFFVSDKSNWWNLYKLDGNDIVPVCPRQAEFGLPQWQFGMIRYGFIDQHTILTSLSENGTEKLIVSTAVIVRSELKRENIVISPSRLPVSLRSMLGILPVKSSCVHHPSLLSIVKTIL